MYVDHRNSLETAGERPVFVDEAFTVISQTRARCHLDGIDDLIEP
jgi:hypothetical protein